MRRASTALAIVGLRFAPAFAEFGVAGSEAAAWRYGRGAGVGRGRGVGWVESWW